MTSVDEPDIGRDDPGWKAIGLSDRRLDTWTTTGRLRAITQPNPGTGHRRLWPASELAVAAVVVRLTAAGLDLDVAFQVARLEGESSTVEIGPGVFLVVDVVPDGAAARITGGCTAAAPGSPDVVRSAG